MKDTSSPVSALLDQVANLEQGSKEAIQLICSQSKLTLTSALEGRPDDAQLYIDFVDRVSSNAALLSRTI